VRQGGLHGVRHFFPGFSSGFFASMRLARAFHPIHTSTMSLKFHLTIISVFILGFQTVGCRAAELSLSAAIAEALAHNPEMRSLEEGVAGAKGGVTTARTLSNPELSIAPGIKHISDSGISKNEFHGSFEVSQFFEFPGKRALKIALAQKNVALQQLALEGFRFELSAKVRRAFYELLAEQNTAGLRNEQVESAKAFVQSARKRAESGYASDFEVVKSQADLISAERDLLEVRGKIAAARTTLNTLLGRAPSAPVAIAGTLTGIAPRAVEAGDFVSLAMARNPGLRTLGVLAESAGLTVRASRLERLPDFSAGPQLEYTPHEQTYGLGVTIALPVWDQKKGGITTATAEQRRALAEIEKTRLEIAGEVTRSAGALRIARDQLALYTPGFLDQLKDLVAQAGQSYAQNATTLIIYLDAKHTYYDTLAQYYESLGNVARQTAELESAVGVPLDLKP
jgi:cobalt-zinc-cadmium efflux system outer membrane protein